MNYRRKASQGSGNDEEHEINILTECLYHQTRLNGEAHGAVSGYKTGECGETLFW